ncbi:MAG: hypothetical protein WCP09_03960 [Candidatus Taylorbacteria bacterium]
MNDDQSQDAIVPPQEAQAPETPVSSPTDGSEASNTPPEAPESPTNDSIITPVKDQNGGVNQPESEVSKPPKVAETSQSDKDQPQLNLEPVQPISTQSAPSAPTLPTPQAPQLQSSAQPDQTGFIRALLAKAQAKIQFNKQKKLDKIILFAQKKKIVANEDIQLLLHISSATATRYLVKLVQQGRLARVGNPRDAKYQFIR